MQKTILIYNIKKGNILSSFTGNFAESDTYQLKMTDVPDGYTVSSVNVETGEPVLEAVPKSDEQQQIDALKEQVAALQAAATQQQKITDTIIGATEREETV